ncbi:O-antigen ligase family protein [Metabacillus sp. JX24]|uniref:O-antigen ligase family protein n=1 Tax=Metabacillus sp. JX24 TaxID=3240759 RepID=UPI00350FE39F
MSRIFIQIVLVILLFQELLAVNLHPLIDMADEVIVVFLAFLVFLKLLKSQTISKHTMLVLLITIAFLFIGFISSFLRDGISINSIISSFLVVKGFIIYITIFELTGKNENRISIIIKTIISVGFILMFFAVIDFLLYEKFRALLNLDYRQDIRAGLVSVQSLMTHPGVYGWFMSLCGIIMFSRYLINKNKKDIIISVIFFLFALISLRFKVIMLLAFLISYLLFKSKNKLLGIIVVSLFVVPIFLFFFGDIFSLTIDRYIQIDYDESARKALYLFSFVIAKEYFPVGTGFGTYGTFQSIEPYSSVYYEFGLNRVWGLRPDNPMWLTDTFWPAILGETGLVGIILYGSVFLIIFRNRKQIKKRLNLYYYYIFIFVFIQAFLESLAEQIYFSSPQFIIIFTLLGLISADLKEKKIEESVNS